MPNTNMGADSVCPFYIGDHDATIRCQSICLTGGECVQRFRCRADKERWAHDVCSHMNRHKLCPVAHILYELYEEENA